MNDEGNRTDRLAAFETSTLLRAVDDVDRMRMHLDGDGYKPPEIRDDLLKLHQLAMRVVNDGWTNGETESEMFDLAIDLESRIEDLAEALERLRDTISSLAQLAPEE